jgi:hypothetical protein
MLVAAALALALAACGGGGGGGGGGDGGDGSDLSARAAEARQFLTSQIEALATVQSKDALVARLTEAQDAAHELSNNIENTEVPPELVNVRAQLGLAMRSLTTDIGRVRGIVVSGDIAAAQELLANLRSIQALEDAIAAVQSAGA